jgi:hypothetical protein
VVNDKIKEGEKSKAEGEKNLEGEKSMAWGNGDEKEVVGKGVVRVEEHVSEDGLEKSSNVVQQKQIYVRKYTSVEHDVL